MLEIALSDEDLARCAQDNAQNTVAKNNVQSNLLLKLRRHRSNAAKPANAVYIYIYIYVRGTSWYRTAVAFLYVRRLFLHRLAFSLFERIFCAPFYT